MFLGKTVKWSGRHAVPGLAWAVVLLVTGCGDGRVRVSGTVVFEGKPVEQGIISFEPTDGVGPTTGGSIPGGKYDLTGGGRSTVGAKPVLPYASRETRPKPPARPPPPPLTRGA